MGFLDWLKLRGKAKQGQEPENEPAPERYATKRGNPIRVIEQGKWHSDYPGYESKMLIGRSIEGYHGGREISYGGGDGRVVWTNARSTRDRAERASWGISSPDEYHQSRHCDRDIDPKAHGHESWYGVYAEIREDEALAKLRNEIGREPDRSELKMKPRRAPSWDR